MPNIHCKICGTEEATFTTISDLRVHQWAAHKERYAKMMITRKNGRPHGAAWRKKISEARRKGIAARKKAGEPVQAVSVRAYKKNTQAALTAAMNGDLKISDFLEELKEQQKFISDVVSLVEGFAAQRQEKKGN